METFEKIKTMIKRSLWNAVFVVILALVTLVALVSRAAAQPQAPAATASPAFSQRHREAPASPAGADSGLRLALAQEKKENGKGKEEEKAEKAAAPAAAEKKEVAADTGDSCVSCHVDELRDEAVKNWSADIHREKGLSCADCHGGNKRDPQESSMEKSTGFRGKPARADIPKFCAACHADPNFMRQRNPSIRTDQYDRYLTSIHGRRLEEGDKKVATCIDCHGVHGILRSANVNSPVYALNVPKTCGRCHSNPQYMAQYKIPTDQVTQYRTSVHGKLLYEKSDLGAPVCNDCHGNHGAFPPEVTSIADVCGQCHVINRDMFVKSPHKVGFDKEGHHECATCHGNHSIQLTSDAMLGVEQGAICARCHESGSQGFDVARAMRAGIESLKAEMEKGKQLLAGATNAGIEVSQALYEFRAANVALIQSRNVMHEINPKAFNDVIAGGLQVARQGQKVGRTAIAEARYRKLWALWPLLGIILMLAGIGLRLRAPKSESERKEKQP